MGKLKQWYFYYGAILTAILEKNPDVSPKLIVNEESKQVYNIETKESDAEYIIYFKYASCKKDTNSVYNSWVFNFTDDDKDRLRKYYNDGKPVFIYLLCLKANLQNSEIVVLKYDEYIQIKNKSAITIGVEPNKKTFYLFSGASKARDDAFLVKRNRITYSFQKLLSDTFCNGSNIKKDEKTTKVQYKNIKYGSKKVIQEQQYEDSNICPVCGEGILTVSRSADRIYNFLAKKCNKCGTIYLQKEDYIKISRQNGGVPLKDNVKIMNWKQEGYEGYSVNIPRKSLHDQKAVDATEKANLIYVLPHNNNICPVHHKKMEIRTIDLGKHIKDTVYYCNACNKLYVEQCRESKLNGFLKSKRALSKYKIVCDDRSAKRKN